MKALLAVCCLALLAWSARAGHGQTAAATPPSIAKSVTSPARTVTEIAKGIFVIKHRDAPDTNPQGNTTVIIGDREVLVVDAGYLPSSTREDIAHGIETDNCKVGGYVLRNEEVHALSPDVALLTLRAMSDVMCGDQPVHSDAWSTTLYVRSGDTWKASFHQETDAQH